MRGGRAAVAMACPTTRVEPTRDSIICRRWVSSYRQFTLRPARLITTSHPSISRPAVQANAIPCDDPPRTRALAPAQHDDVVPVAVKRTGEDRADLSGSAGYDDFHWRLRGIGYY